jgi:large subunit ribosomal protein L9
MKIVLLEKVVNLGNLGDIVEVANGYARNFLIPFNKAKRANDANLKDFEARRAEYEQKQLSVFGDAEARHAKINEKTFTVTAKAGVDGKLFGSVSSFDIVSAIQSSCGVEIKKSEVRLPNGALKTVGEFDIDVDLHHDLRAVIKVAVTPEA